MSAVAPFTSTQKSPDFLDELTPIATYMAREMNRNASSEAARHMRELNGFGSTRCKDDPRRMSLLDKLLEPKSKQMCLELGAVNSMAALLAWAELVHQDGPWDHKRYIRTTFHPRSATTQEYHAHGNKRYYYDMWSNIHYGFVGSAAGFSSMQLLDGAGLEQIGSSLIARHRPVRQGEVVGKLRDWDGANDRLSIQLGVSLYNHHRGGVTAKILLDAVLSSAIQPKTSK